MAYQQKYNPGHPLEIIDYTAVNLPHWLATYPATDLDAVENFAYAAFRKDGTVDAQAAVQLTKAIGRLCMEQEHPSLQGEGPMPRLIGLALYRAFAKSQSYAFAEARNLHGEKFPN